MRRRSRPNDLRQYDELAGEWWRPDGAFAALHWLARARGELIPSPSRRDAELLDLGCGGGLLAPYVSGYRHVGVDLSTSALEVAARHGVDPVRADVTDLPFRDQRFDVVVAGEIFEHVENLERSIAEAARVLRPGGTVIFDTINATPLARVLLVTIGERVPGGPPPGCHDARLFVSPDRVRTSFARHGIALRFWGLRPDVRQYAGFVLGRRRCVRMRRTRSLSAVYQGVGEKTSCS